MKNGLLFILTFLVSCSIFAQRDAQFYQTENKKYAFKLEENSCTLYELDNYNTAVYYEYELLAAKKMEQPEDSMGVLYSNIFFGVSYNHREFSVVKIKRGKVKKTYRANRLQDPAQLFEVINHSHWNEVYEHMLREIESDFKLFGAYRYRHFGHSWEAIAFKQLYPEEFELQAKQQIAWMKDSIVRTNQQLIALNDTIKNNIHTLTFEDLKSNFQSRSLHEYAYSKYTREFLSTVALMRPALYLELTQAFPEEKNYLFSQAAFDRDMNRSIKKYVEPGPVKKEYLKFKRRERFKAGLILTGVVVLDAAIITGLVALFL